MDTKDSARPETPKPGITGYRELSRAELDLINEGKALAVIMLAAAPHPPIAPDALRAAAEKARAALSDLLLRRDPIVYSDALRALDEALAQAPIAQPQAAGWRLPENATEAMQKAMQRQVLLRRSMNDVWRAALAELPEPRCTYATFVMEAEPPREAWLAYAAAREAAERERVRGVLRELVEAMVAFCAAEDEDTPAAEERLQRADDAARAELGDGR